MASEAALIGISSMATRHVLGEITEAYANASAQRVEMVSVGGVDATRRVRSGERFDFVVLAANAIDELGEAGCVQASGRVDVVRSGIAIAVAAGAPKPDIGSAQAVREAVLAARSIGYSTGPSGVYLARLFERWGIADAIAPRTVQAPPGVPVAELVARGDVALGFQQLSELMHVPGIAIVGPLPPDIQLFTLFSAAVCATSERAEATARLLAYLASPPTAEAKRRHGMEPA